jgi:hypothetical protein
MLKKSIETNKEDSNFSLIGFLLILIISRNSLEKTETNLETTNKKTEIRFIEKEKETFKEKIEKTLKNKLKINPEYPKLLKSYPQKYLSFSQEIKNKEKENLEKILNYEIPDKKDFIKTIIKNTPEEKQDKIKRLAEESLYSETLLKEEEKDYIQETCQESLKTLAENVPENNFFLLAINKNLNEEQNLILGKKIKGKIVLISSFALSMAKKGFSEENNSHKTPRGLFKIKTQSQIKKIVYKGKEIPIEQNIVKGLFGQKFKDMSMDNIITWGVNLENDKSRMITSGFISLHGQEYKNQNALSREIGLHANNQEQYLGSPNSNGCLNISNIDFFRLVSILKDQTESFLVIDDQETETISLVKNT